MPIDDNYSAETPESRRADWLAQALESAASPIDREEVDAELIALLALGQQLANDMPILMEMHTLEAQPAASFVDSLRARLVDDTTLVEIPAATPTAQKAPASARQRGHLRRSWLAILAVVGSIVAGTGIAALLNGQGGPLHGALFAGSSIGEAATSTPVIAMAPKQPSLNASIHPQLGGGTKESIAPQPSFIPQATQQSALTRSPIIGTPQAIVPLSSVPLPTPGPNQAVVKQSLVPMTSSIIRHTGLITGETAPGFAITPGVPGTDVSTTVVTPSTRTGTYSPPLTATQVHVFAAMKPPMKRAQSGPQHSKLSKPAVTSPRLPTTGVAASRAPRPVQRGIVSSTPGPPAHAVAASRAMPSRAMPSMPIGPPSPAQILQDIRDRVLAAHTAPNSAVCDARPYYPAALVKALLHGSHEPGCAKP